MKKSTKKLISGGFTAAVIWAVFLIYDFIKTGHLSREMLLCCLIFIMVYLIVGVLLNKFWPRD